MDLTNRRWVDRAALDCACPERLAGLALTGFHVAGSLAGLSAPTVAIVGTRAPSDGGRALARRLGQELGAAGVCVISGLALGIDAAAHEGALAVGARTIGVLGGGHDHFFPPRNRELAARMVTAGGAVVSPYAPDEPARPYQFLARNGIVAALADVVVVVEAAARSGALNTASWAADRGVPVLAVPGDVDRPKVAGCLALIRDGATLARSSADVFEALGIAAPARADVGPPDGPPDSPDVCAILAALTEGECDLETLVGTLGRTPGSLARVLLELEVSGRVVCRANGYALTGPL